MAPRLLSGKAAIAAFGAYHCHPGGIYKLDKHLGYRLRPDMEKRIYWNGHWWLHRTNRYGYRGSEVASPDLVLLGDSLIYGHGVDNDSTAATQLSRLTGMSVANLGQQGTCLVQMWKRYRDHSSQWHPKAVLVCFHPNDINDASFWYPLSEQKKFLASAIESQEMPLVRSKYQPRSPWNPVAAWNRHLAIPLRSSGLIRYCIYAVSKGFQSKPLPGSGQSGQFLPTKVMKEAPFAPRMATCTEAQRIGWQVQVHALKKLKWLCDQQGAELILFDLGYPYAFSGAVKELASTMKVKYVPAGQAVLDEGIKGKEVYLGNGDGHWTGLGNRILAKKLAEAIRPMAGIAQSR